MSKLFFDDWDSILRTVVITVLAYVFMIFLLRISGKRTLSKMNAFDFVVTIALGSTLATVSLTKNVALADGVLAFFLLIFLQYLITFLSTRYQSFDRIIKSSPSLIVYRGRLLKDIMLKERIAEDEVFAVIREKGISYVEDVDAVVLETDGSLTVIEKLEKPFSETMNRVNRPTDVKQNINP